VQLGSTDHPNSPRNPLNLFVTNQSVATSREAEE